VPATANDMSFSTQLSCVPLRKTPRIQNPSLGTVFQVWPQQGFPLASAVRRVISVIVPLAVTVSRKCPSGVPSGFACEPEPILSDALLTYASCTVALLCPIAAAAGPTAATD